MTPFRAWMIFGVFVGLAAGFSASHPTQSGEPLPQPWRVTMTNDPATNYALVKFSAPLATPLAGVARNLVLAGIVRQACKGASVNRTTLQMYTAQSGINTVSRDVL